MTDPKNNPEPYLPRVAEKVVRKAPGIFVVDVIHEDHCAHWEGKPCNCNPELGDPVRVLDPGENPTLH